MLLCVAACCLVERCPIRIVLLCYLRLQRVVCTHPDTQQQRAQHTSESGGQRVRRHSTQGQVTDRLCSRSSAGKASTVAHTCGWFTHQHLQAQREQQPRKTSASQAEVACCQRMQSHSCTCCALPRTGCGTQRVVCDSPQPAVRQPTHASATSFGENFHHFFV